MKRIYHVLVVIFLSACNAGSQGAVDGPGPSAPACADEMVLIPGGDYLLGRTITVPPWNPPSDAVAPLGYWSLPNPAATVAVRAFCIDVFEFPNQRGVMPQANVSWNDATRLCAELGKRLPSRTEWQAAAQGKSGNLYSYGPEFEQSRCNTNATSGSFEAISPAGSFPRCASRLGVFDLNGNVSEWVLDDWAGPWQANALWGGPEARPKTMMGGTAWGGDIYGQDSTSRHRHPPHQRWKDDGFRCAKNTELIEHSQP
jgi:formylglycine-generating enzyme required for sulfatase activity